VHSEIKEVVDQFVHSMIAKLPRFKINCFAQELANLLLTSYFAENPGVNEDLPKNAKNYWTFRQGDYLCPLLINALNSCAISPFEFMHLIPEKVHFKIEGNGIISSVWGNESKVVNTGPFKKTYFEVPLRVLKAAIHQRLSMVVYRHGIAYDGGFPNNFIPLILVAPSSVGTKTASKAPMFQAVGLPVYLFSAEQLNKTTFGSHNTAQAPDEMASGNIFGPSGDVRSSLFSESHKIDFFAPGWWERIAMSQMVGEYVEEAKNNSYICNVLNAV